MTVKGLLINKRVKALVNCNGVEANKIYWIDDYDKYLVVGPSGNHCYHPEHWELMEHLPAYRPAPHKHKLTCSDCGEEIKKIK